MDCATPGDAKGNIDGAMSRETKRSAFVANFRAGDVSFLGASPCPEGGS